MINFLVMYFLVCCFLFLGNWILNIKLDVRSLIFDSIWLSLVCMIDNKIVSFLLLVLYIIFSNKIYNYIFKNKK
jgi:uncharacterized membrane protein